MIYTLVRIPSPINTSPQNDFPLHSSYEHMTFQDLNLNKGLLNALSDMGMTIPTAIQEKTFSPIMAGRDVLGIAQTGTGKTFAYLLPTMRLWKYSKSMLPQILIIVPTRELVAQVVEEVEKLATYTNIKCVGVYGGTNIRTQKTLFIDGADVVVGTPGRLQDLMLDGVLKTKDIKKMIIDEVDEMLHLGFRTQLNMILDFLPKRRQNLMFSATLNEDVEQVIGQFSDRYERIEAAPSGAPLENIDQYGYAAPNFNTKANLLELLLAQSDEMNRVLVFVSTRRKADALYDRMLPILGEDLGVIHSSKSQNNRFNSVSNFQSGEHRVLIATDIIARGLDVSMVTHVINFDLTDTPEQYIHRIGRTGRAEAKGQAISFISEEEAKYQKEIEALMSLEINMIDAPEELVISEKLIPLELTVEHIPFDHRKNKQHVPSGPAFHEKKEANKKVNFHMTRDETNKLKYKKSGKKKKKKDRAKKW